MKTQKKSYAKAIAISKEDALLQMLLAPLYAIGEFMYGDEKRTRTSLMVAGICLVVAFLLQMNESHMAQQSCFR